MSTFSYTARDRAGQEIQGTKEAASKAGLARAFHQEGYLLTSAVPLEEKKKRMGFPLVMLKGLFKRVSLTEKMMFARHLSVMLKAGLPLNRSLDILSQQTKSRYFAKILSLIEGNIRAGQTFSDGLAKYPSVFSNLFVGMIRVGEAGGTLEEVLNLLAEQIKKEHELRSKVKGALVYPGVVVTAMIGIGILMMIMVVPKLTAVFEELKIELPLSTRIIIGFSKGLQSNLIFLAIGLAALIFLARTLLKNKKIKTGLDWLILHLPIFSGISKKINIARIARTMGSLIDGGIPIIKGLEITQDTLGNSFFKNSLDACAKQVQKGNPLSSALLEYKFIYPPMVTQMIQVGEETGTLSDILKRLADFYEEEVSTIAKSLSSVIEPVLMIIVGAAVAFFAISMVQPMYSMMEAI